MYTYASFKPLIGQNLEIRRLRHEDIPELISNLYSEKTWVISVRGVNSKEKLKTYFEGFINRDSKNESLSLAVRLRSSDEIVGFSCFFDASSDFHKIEIGSTWIADYWTRTFVNTEKKFLMLKYAFETMKVKRVQFSVDPSNEKSYKAVLRLGAKFEGTFRKWRPANEFDEGHRNIYSIIDDDWQITKAYLLKALSR